MQKEQINKTKTKKETRKEKNKGNCITKKFKCVLVTIYISKAFDCVNLF